MTEEELGTLRRQIVGELSIILGRELQSLETRILKEIRSHRETDPHSYKKPVPTSYYGKWKGAE